MPGARAIFLGALFETQNVAFMVGLAFAIATSINSPVLFLSMYRRRLITWGAFLRGFLGLFTAVPLMILGPTAWVDFLGHYTPVFPYKYPALFSMTMAFTRL